ncbi:hypothetical protein EDB84DRAFT_253072 [Lactarius hengduanensis]|nr:hypothetical protein EDB84DRAFT_253072 [Lactarius hengduanensis]
MVAAPDPVPPETLWLLGFSFVRLALCTCGLHRSDRVCVCYTNTVFLKDEGIRSCPQGLPAGRCGSSRCSIPDRGPPLGASALSESQLKTRSPLPVEEGFRVIVLLQSRYLVVRMPFPKSEVEIPRNLGDGRNLRVRPPSRCPFELSILASAPHNTHGY